MKDNTAAAAIVVVGVVGMIAGLGLLLYFMKQGRSTVHFERDANGNVTEIIESWS